MALWSNASALDRKIEGSNPAANFLLLVNDHRRAKQKQIWKRKQREKARPRTTTDARARSLEWTRSRAFKRERKDSIQRMWIERPFMTREAS